MSVCAIVPAGGSSRRFGRDKLDATRQGVTVLETVLAGALAVADEVIVVGPQRSGAVFDDPRVRWTREEPAGGGPVAAVAAGVALAAADVLLLLAGDAPHGASAAAALLEQYAAHPNCQAAVLVDAAGRRQPLTAAFAADALRGALADLADGVQGAAMHALIEQMRVVEVRDVWQAADDIDTPGDARRLGFS